MTKLRTLGPLLCYARMAESRVARANRGFAWAAYIAMFCLVTAIAAPAQTCKVLYNFGVDPQRPNDPIFQGIIAQGHDGNIYTGSRDTWTGGDGRIFKTTSAGELTVLHLFDGTDW